MLHMNPDGPLRSGRNDTAGFSETVRKRLLHDGRRITAAADIRNAGNLQFVIRRLFSDFRILQVQLLQFVPQHQIDLGHLMLKRILLPVRFRLVQNVHGFLFHLLFPPKLIYMDNRGGERRHPSPYRSVSLFCCRGGKDLRQEIPAEEAACPHSRAA